MLFNSIEFFVFFLVVYALYLSLRHRAQNVLLLAASYFFYACWDWRYLGLIWLATTIDYVAGLRIAKSRRPRARKAWVFISVAAHLAMLGFFKYYGFFTESLGPLLGALGLQASSLRLHIVLPVGISFYTFQTMSYTIDVYRGEVEPTKNVLDFALFVAYFPQLVAGPIERGKRLLPQITSPRTVTLLGAFEGAHLIVWGIVKKVVFADNLAVAVDYAYAPGSGVGCVSMVIATVAFAAQIYCDFSGYSDVARGCGRLMGIDLMLNFNAPYFAISMRDFWRRWHISLSTWLRDYVYIPLGGSRAGRRRTYLNLMVTMLLGGLWHGASWAFVLWGGYHGLLLAAERAFCRRMPTRDWPNCKTVRERLVWGSQVLLTFVLVCIGWVMFRSASLPLLADAARKILRPESLSLAAIHGETAMAYVIGLLLVEAIGCFRDDVDWPMHIHWTLRGTAYAGLWLLVLLFGHGTGEEFIYFQF